jgi:hypothetical protein
MTICFNEGATRAGRLHDRVGGGCLISSHWCDAGEVPGIASNREGVRYLREGVRYVAVPGR